MRKPKVALIGTVGLPANYGGFETLAEHLVEELHTKYEITVYCTKKKYAKEKRTKKYKGARLVYLPFDANGIQSILYDSISILHALFFADVLLVLGVSGGFMLPVVRLLTRKKIIVSIDGIEWKRNKWKKAARFYLWAAEWVSVKFAHANIADNEAIQDYTAVRYKTLSNIIEYGADHTLEVEPSKEDYSHYPFLKEDYYFKVCRIEPENNLHVVLEAFASLPSKPLVIIGNWQKSDYGKGLKAQYGGHENLHLLDPIYNQQVLDVLRGHCLAYIHGHSAGGTNPSLVEAMYLGRPVIAFKVAYNVCTTEGRALYFTTTAQLAHLIANTHTTQLTEVATHMKGIANRRYTWPIVAAKYGFLIDKAVAFSYKAKLVPEAGERLSNRHLLQQEIAHLQNPSLFYEKR